MKTNAAPDQNVTTPPQKKLKQARLPFKLISDVSPKPDVPLTRKRKLSGPNEVPVSKVGKLSKENDLLEDSVVISDDESKSDETPQKEEKLSNPFVKLVDKALKKKQQKTKTTKKKKTKSSKNKTNVSPKEKPIANAMDCGYDEYADVEVEVQIHEDDNEQSGTTDQKLKSDSNHNTTKRDVVLNNDNSPQNKPDKTPRKSSETQKITEEIVCLDDSNHSINIIKTKCIDQEIIESEPTHISLDDESGDSEKDCEKPKESVEKDMETDSFETPVITTPKRSARNKARGDEKSNVNKSDNNHNATKPDGVINNDNSPPNKPDKSPKQSSETQETTEEIICLSDSNHSIDIKKTGFIDQEMIESEPTHISLNDESGDSEKKDCEKPKESVEKEMEMDTFETPVITTPKRSTRNKARPDEKSIINTSTTSSNLDDSISSDPTTPKRDTRSLSVPSSQGDGLNVSAVNLTPKQLQKRLESAKKKEEKEKEKQEREKKRQLEKEERAKQKQEKEDQRKRERDEKEEAKRKEKKEREEKEEQKKKEREERKELEKKAKEIREEQKRKEREDKEEQRKKEKESKEEERRKKQDALELEKQEQEQKKKKAAEAFVNFFVPKQKVEKGHTVAPVSKNSVLSSFTIKGDMRLAPTVRVDLSDEQREVLDKVLKEQDVSKNGLYLKCLKKGTTKPLSSGKTWPLSDRDDDIMIVEDELPPNVCPGEIITCEPAEREKLHPKLLSFHENRRPPYWGTWRKKSLFVKPRRPFGQDEKQLEYEGDSDEEWEEVQEGESLDGSACGSEDEGDPREDYEVDNEVFVPHGYLSDEEATMEEDDMLSLSPETQKARLKHLEDEFESEMKKPTEKLKPRLYGLLWETTEGCKPDECIDALWNYFEKFSMVMNDPMPLLQPSNEPEEAEKKKVKKKKVVTEGGEVQSPKVEKKKKSKPESKESKKPKQDTKKTAPNQPGINSFLTKLKGT